MFEKYKLAAVIIAYNEEKFINETITNIPAYIDKVYVVDDGSTDRTRQIVEKMQNNRIILISNRVNQGPGGALVQGYKRSIKEHMDIIVKMDGDGQMNSLYLSALLTPIVRRNADYTKGNRLTRLARHQGMSNWRFFGNWILTILTRFASGYWYISDTQNGFTAITREALSRIDIDDLYHYYGYLNDLLVKLNIANCKVVDVPMPARYGQEKSKIKYYKYIPKVSFLLLRKFFWRIWEKYLRGRMGRRV